jgi:UDP-N-acetylmuramoyl-L-alanyl-D-glutamate--2,6-diaminopimelate ligase
MGKVVQSLSDLAIVTSDNPRFENLQQIFDDILSGMKKDETVTVIEDREEAIKKSIELANEGDVVLIAGKGHETYQIVKNQRIPFDDKKVAEKYLQERFGK